MPIPNQIKRALEKSQLSPVLNATVISSGHKIERVEWTDSSGQLKKGFYKPVKEDGTYPCLLAKFEVAIHARYKLSHGQVFPSDYLVFDAHNKIVGTVSEEIEGFRPLEDGPEITVELLIKNNAATIIVPSILMQCDDRHPQNFGYRQRADGSYAFFIIDLDMALYRYTAHIKGGRELYYDELIRVISSYLFELSRYDLDNSPIVKEHRVHWFTHFPYNGNIQKAYKSSTLEAFKALAADPRYHLQDHERHAFDLVTYDPQCLKARLFEVLGTLPLSYTNLLGARRGLETNFPDQFHQDVDQQPFIDTMMNIFDADHQHNYSEVVFYPGCIKNVAGVPKISFHQYLLQAPDLLQKICVWAEDENHQLGEARASIHHNMDNIKSNFHIMWRDSFSLRIRSMLLNLRSIQESLAQDAIIVVDFGVNFSAMEASVYMPQSAGKEPEDQAEPALWKILDHFIKDLTQVFNRYFAVSSASPDALLQANKICCEHVRGLLDSEGKMIREQLPATHAAYQYLELLLQHMNFSAYLARKSGDSEELGCFKPMPSTVFNPQECSTVTRYVQRLFEWAADPRVLFILVNSIEAAMVKNTPSIANFYAAQDERTEEIARYLKRVMTSQKEKEVSSSDSSVGQEILAYILGNGKVNAYALNTLIMNELLPKVLEDSYCCFNIDVENFLDCYNARKLDLVMYTAVAKSCILSDKKYAHVLTEVIQNQFIRALYKWVDTMKPEIFRKYVADALRAYNSSRGVFASSFFPSRSLEIALNLTDYQGSNAAILGLIFCKGGTNSESWKDVASFNYRLYNNLLNKLFAGQNSLSFDAKYSFPEGITRKEADSFLQLPRFQEQAKYQSEFAVKTADVVDVHDGFVLVEKM